MDMLVKLMHTTTSQKNYILGVKTSFLFNLSSMFVIRITEGIYNNNVNDSDNTWNFRSNVD
jgi:hypothetical protein